MADRGDHSEGNLRYDGKPEKAPVLMDREDKRWRTSIESKQREKYETNQINQNIRGKLTLRGVAGRSVCADDNNDNVYRPGNGHNYNAANDHQCGGKYSYLHPGFGLLHVPNDVSCAALTVLLHKGYDRGRSGGPGRELVRDPSGHAGHCLLLNSGRSGCGAKSNIGPTSGSGCD
jgi:hypothetical protein